MTKTINCTICGVPMYSEHGVPLNRFHVHESLRPTMTKTTNLRDKIMEISERLKLLPTTCNHDFDLKSQLILELLGVVGELEEFHDRI